MGTIIEDHVEGLSMHLFYSVKGVSINLQNDEFYVKVGEKIELRAERQEDGTWFLYDREEAIGGFDTFTELWTHVEELGTFYDLFPAQWRSEHFDFLCALFRTVPK